MSYYEISNIALYLEHAEAASFRRLSKTCNYAACGAILRNLQEFDEAISGTKALQDQAFLKEKIPDSLD